MQYEEAVRYIEDIPRFTKKNSMDNTILLLDQLGHPEEAFPVVHVAGTNGKGSVCAFLESIFRESGKKTGLFSSPHLLRINERFQVMRQDISDRDFLISFEECLEASKRIIEKGACHPTYFEFLFAMGMVYFRRMQIDILIMETGLGGRLDATNSVAHPVLTLITSIGLDHMEYLGNSVREIAAEKAGILKKGCPLVYDAGSPEAGEVIREAARRKGLQAVPVYPNMAGDIRRGDKSIAFVLNNRYYDYVSVSLPFAADYQLMNCMLAMTAVRVMDTERRIPDSVIVRGIASTCWRGRMDEVMKDVYVDGAHNEDGIREFLRTVRRIQEKRPVSLLYSCVADKHYEKIIPLLCREADFQDITVTELEGPRCVKAETLADIFRAHTPVRVEAEADRPEAFRKALEKKGDGVLFCTGSLYLAGEILRILQ